MNYCLNYGFIRVNVTGINQSLTGNNLTSDQKITVLLIEGKLVENCT